MDLLRDPTQTLATLELVHRSALDLLRAGAVFTPDEVTNADKRIEAWSRQELELQGLLAKLERAGEQTVVTQ